MAQPVEKSKVKPEATFAEKEQVYSDIRAQYHKIAGLFHQANIDFCHYTMPEKSILAYSTLKRLELVRASLNVFLNSEAVVLFTRLYNLNPPAYWAASFNDPVMSTAKDVQLFKGACQLLRASWRDTKRRTFFQVKEKKENPGKGA